MKKIFLTILFLLIFYPKFIFSCAIPPDIIHEFRVDYEGKNIEYSLLAWDNLHKPTINLLEKISGKSFENKNLDYILQKTVLNDIRLKINNKDAKLKFIEWEISKNANFQNTENYEQTPIFKAKLKLSEDINFDNKNILNLEYNKKNFLEISPLIHSYIILSFDNSIAKYYVINSEWKTFDIFEKWWQNFVVNNFLEENDNKNNFEIFFEKLNNNYTNPHKPKLLTNSYTTKENIEIKNSNTKDVINTKDVLKNFFNKNTSIIIQFLWIFVALVLWMFHGLLPWHSKTILSTYIISNNFKQKKDIFVLILASSISHTFFIFIIAIIIIIFQKWTWATTQIAKNITSFAYILFWMFFVWQALIMFKKDRENIFLKQKLNHQKDCWCIIHNNFFKKTFWTGVIAWANPCVDALVLFIFAINIWNIFYATILIIFFSIWIWLMLGILAFMVAKWKNFLNKKSSLIAKKITKYIILIAWIFIIISAILNLI